MQASIDWLLDCSPRPVQLEALNRSYRGVRIQDAIDLSESLRKLPHYPNPAKGWGHFLEMRLGKTPVALNEFMLFKRDHGLKRLFVLSPNKYKFAGANEASQFGVDVPIFVWEASRRRDYEAFIRAHRGEAMLVVNYEALINNDNVIRFLSWVNQSTLMVADESAMIKNNKSLFFKNSLLLSKKVGATRSMTGLPTPQGPHDLWTQLRFARQLEGVNYYAFKNTYARLGGFQNRKVLGVKNEDRLRKLLDQCAFRARKKDWGVDNKVDYEIVELDMHKVQTAHYLEMERQFVTWVELSGGSESVSADMVITKRMKMQQIASGFIMSEERIPLPLMPFDKTPKFIDLKDRLDNYINGKMIVVAHYRYTVGNLMKYLRPYNPAFIVGGSMMEGSDVEEQKARFNNDPECKILIGQSQAMKYGHTLMGSDDDPCLSLCFFENNYSLDVRSQVEERPQGVGQKGPLHIWDYFSSGIERDIVKALQDKRDVATVIMVHHTSSTAPALPCPSSRA